MLNPVPLRRVVLTALMAVVAAVAFAAMGATPADAHNSLSSSDPSDGSVLTAAPSQIVWTFDASVPLETMTVTLIDRTMARIELPGSRHAPAGDNVVITPLPALPTGEVSVRWRLVSPDGHAISGRVDFTVGTASDVSSPSMPVIGANAGQGVADPSTDRMSDSSSVFRWLLRYLSYLAIMTVVGLLLVTARVWRDATAHPVLRRLLSGALVVVAVLAFLQVLVVASDITGTSMWSSIDAIDAALSIDAGRALAIRIVLAVALWLVLFRQEIAHPDVFWTAISLPAVGLLGTWAFAGHAGSMRWPIIGVTTDVVHHGAAALWIAGLAIVAWVVIPTEPPSVVASVVRAFSRAAAVCVGVLVVTGAVQSVRLVGNPIDLVTAAHGRYLALKLVAFAAMLYAAHRNRRRLQATLHDDVRLGAHLPSVRRTVLTEFAIGLVIIAITAAMVVSPPATSIA